VSDGGKDTLSGPKGFAIILGGMFGVIGVLWLVATLMMP
jgi:hypothetical protein